jgi:hypothetical protein
MSQLIKNIGLKGCFFFFFLIHNKYQIFILFYFWGGEQMYNKYQLFLTNESLKQDHVILMYKCYLWVGAPYLVV